jgi:uncharacterized protein
MEAKPVTIKILALSFTPVLAVEGVLRITPLGSSLAALGLTRLLQIAVMLWVAAAWSGGTAAIGLDLLKWLHGLRRGALWSLAFGAVALCAFLVLSLAGINALSMIRVPLPQQVQTLVLLFLVGGVIAPVAEEVFFRGFLYSFFRRWGIASALIISTLLFVLSHPLDQGLPVIQAVGGLVFAVSYEKEGTLLVPITIHVLGNLAVFGLSLGI